jgi:hypothetical protein
MVNATNARPSGTRMLAISIDDSTKVTAGSTRPNSNDRKIRETTLSRKRPW